MKKKSILSIILILLLITSIVIPITLNVFASGEDFTYDSETGVLDIYSDDVMIDYTEANSNTTPWYSYKSDIKKIVIHKGVTRIGSYNFARLDNLAEIEVPTSVTTIGTAALTGNNKLLSITLSENVTSIGTNAFGFNREMKVTEGFVCNCPAGSFVQTYCFRNYIPFSTPIPESMSATANIKYYDYDNSDEAKQVMWSYTPAVDTKVTFYAEGGYDTKGFIYDAENYVYSTTYSVMAGSAIASGDDEKNLNFVITKALEAGKTYYLSARFSLPSKEGKFDVKFETECVSHTLVPTGIDEWFRGTVLLECDVCGHNESASFAQAVKDQDMTYDINNDGVVNAKDYAYLLKM